ncbi:MAG: hypothetical protein ACRD1K_10305 [Acidimicrobiales bacterium]
MDQPVPAGVSAQFDAIAPGARLIKLPELASRPEEGGDDQGPVFANFTTPGPGRDRSIHSTCLAVATPELVELFGLGPDGRRALNRDKAVSVVGPVVAGGAFITLRRSWPGPTRESATGDAARRRPPHHSPAASDALPKVGHRGRWRPGSPSSPDSRHAPWPSSRHRPPPASGPSWRC